MRLVSAHNGRLLTSLRSEELALEKTFVTGLDALDDLAPRGRFARGAIHELLVDPAEGLSQFVAMMLARAAAKKTGGTDIPVGVGAMYSSIRIGCRSTGIRHRQ